MTLPLPFGRALKPNMPPPFPLNGPGNHALRWPHAHGPAGGLRAAPIGERGAANGPGNR
jgi:hypothetical protein